MRLVIVTGLSGSGKSIALNTLEDQGYFCIDNLPIPLLEALARHLIGDRDQGYAWTAVGIDARSRPDALSRVPAVVGLLRENGIACEVLFLEADDETLIKRFSETRRRHPLTDERRPLAEAIQTEREILGPMRTLADLQIDTTHSNVHQLRDLVRERVSDRETGRVSLLLQSFGYKHGLPADADFVFDARCLPNPHWRTELRPMTGRDADVADFLESHEDVREMRTLLAAFLDRWIPCFEADGRSYLTVAIGCTGGQHRSVYLIEALANHLRRRGRSVLTRHRELP
ncbi:MAG: RNase adapter RapZ [Chromatiales bacterium]|jgi:UPF0042 nucleotide-binding protein